MVRSLEIGTLYVHAKLLNEDPHSCFNFISQKVIFKVKSNTLPRLQHALHALFYWPKSKQMQRGDKKSWQAFTC